MSQSDASNEHAPANLHRAIIITSEPDFAGELCHALTFLGLDSEIVDPASLAARIDSGADCSAVLLCGQAATPALLRLLDRWEDGPPVLAVETDLKIPPGLARLGARLLGRIERPLRHAQIAPLLERVNRWQPAPRDAELFRSMVGKSESIQRIREMIGRVAPTDSTVLILGETGTGKEVAARHIHYHSLRRSGPFVAVNCGAIPADLLESELFGHERGAFTGALTARKGRFELAEGGTLFLDEIGDMSLQMQVKLLRVLQERQFERLGSGRPQAADVRIVCATHRNLDEMVGAGTFRGDLFYRINVFPIEMPSLRERREDLPLLTVELVSRLEAEGRGAVKFTAEALAAMARYDWPGNVRELANVVERLAILHPGAPVRAADLPRNIRALVPATNDAMAEDLPFAGGAGGADELELAGGTAWGPGRGLKDYLNDIEEQLIRKALAESGGTVAEAAKALGMRRTTLVEKLRKFGIDRQGFASES